MPIKFNGIVCFVVAGGLVGCSVIGWKNDTLWEQPPTHREFFVPNLVTVTSLSVSGSNVAAKTYQNDMYVADWRLAKRDKS